MNRLATLSLVALTASLQTADRLEASTITVDLDTAGTTQSVSTVQPSLALTAMVQMVGDYVNGLGQVKFFGGNFVPRGFAQAAGQLLSISQNTALFSLYGTTYGGDGETTFALPDLRGRTVVGTGGSYSLGQKIGQKDVTISEANLPAHEHETATGSSTTTGQGQSYSNLQPGLALDFEIVTQGTFPSEGGGGGAAPEETLGFVQIDAASQGAGGDTFDRDKVPATGALTSIASNTALFSLLGTNYGGDGETTFGMPDTRDRIVTGAGNGPGLSPRSLGQQQGSAVETLTLGEMQSHVHGDPDLGGSTLPAGGSFGDNNLQPEISMNWMVALTGVFPSQNLTDGISNLSLFDGPILGEIALFAGNFAPGGWAFANGQLLAISQNQALFSLFGTNYGGDGETTFALPDLRGRTPIGTSYGGGALDAQSMFIGARSGTETVSILAEHGHSVDRITPVPIPATLPLLIAGFGLLALRRRHA